MSEVMLKVAKLRRQTFEAAIIECYRRRVIGKAEWMPGRGDKEVNPRPDRNTSITEKQYSVRYPG